MNNKQKLSLLKAVTLLGVLFGSTSAFAAEGVIPACQYMPIAATIINGDAYKGLAARKAGNEALADSYFKECVDIPLQAANFKQNHVVFSLDSRATKDGTDMGTPNGLRHLVMMGRAMQFRAKHGLLDPANVQMIGIIHGTALNWALSDAWWQAQVDDDGNQLYPDGNPYKDLIDSLFDMNAGVNTAPDGTQPAIGIQLETCAVTLYGAGLTADDVYSDAKGRIYVNQGAIGRIVDLQQRGYALMMEGWNDAADAYYVKKMGMIK